MTTGFRGVDPAADVALSLGRRSSSIDWAAWVDPIAFMYGVVRPYVPVNRADLVPGSGAWVTPRLVENRPYTIPSSGGKVSPTQLMDVGRMRWGRDPEAGGSDDRVLAEGGPTTVELRIPWALLTMADPSSRKAGWPILVKAFRSAARRERSGGCARCVGGVARDRRYSTDTRHTTVQGEVWLPITAMRTRSTTARHAVGAVVIHHRSADASNHSAPRRAAPRRHAAPAAHARPHRLPTQPQSTRS